MQPMPDLVVLSHLRWDFVFQRPQHLMTRAARQQRVFFFEEPIIQGGTGAPRLDVRSVDGVFVAQPHLPHGLSQSAHDEALVYLLNELFARHRIKAHVLWYYTPNALLFSRHLEPLATVFDCMDELSAFKGASPRLRELEAELLRRADVVFTGGHSLYEAKRHAHTDIHAVPSSVDRAHFASAREPMAEPADQAAIPHPRVGFFGVIDERMDVALLDGLAELRPDLHLVMIGPVVKIDPATLPRRPNIHWLGGKSYGELPAYIAGWDVAMLPFARNESTRFISPTKTPEYLAAGKPVVSTSIRDVVRPYGDEGLARIADEPAEMAAAIAAALNDDPDELWAAADQLLARTSWDGTWARMHELITAAIDRKRAERERLRALRGGVRRTAQLAPASLAAEAK
jgi:glycosyltransferase involved in cell wall biosynthesis